MSHTTVGRSAWVFWIVLLAFSPAIARSADPGKPARPPNVVIVFTDDLGYADVGCFGAKGYETPNIDRLAKEGVRFTDFYVAQAVCSASRTALLTGCYPNRLGILGALGPASTNGISDDETTLAEVFKSRGYATAIYGKWHLGHHPRFLPTRHGFDEYFGLPYSNDMWPKHPTAKFPDLPLIENEKTIERNPDQKQLTTWYADHATRFIEKNRDQPFFLYVAHSMPHVPLHVSDKFAGKSKMGLFADVILEIDWSVGQILEALKKHNLDDNTLVIFTSDNGPWLSYGNHAGSAAPLREGKGTSWDGGVREPCAMRWPGKIPAGHVCREPAMTIDILPTMAKLIGADLPKNKIDGLDIWPLISGKAEAKCPHEALYFYWDCHLQAIRSGQWKLHFPHQYRTLNGKPGGKDGQPVPYEQAETPLVLFDLATDPGETINVADKHPDVVERLKKLAEVAREDLGDSATKQEGKGVREPGRVFLRQAEPTLVGHRGLLHHAPENTLAGFSACIDLRLGFELDVRRSKDGRLVCVHDDEVQRTTGQPGKVADLTLADLKKLDAGKSFDPAFSGQKVPTLDEVLTLLKQRQVGSVLVALDLKVDGETTLTDTVKLVAKQGLLNQVVCIGQAIESPEVRKTLKAADARIPVAVLAKTEDDLPAVLADKNADWVYLRFIPTAEQVAQATRPASACSWWVRWWPGRSRKTGEKPASPAWMRC